MNKIIFVLFLALVSVSAFGQTTSIGKVSAHGMLFKDSINIEKFVDPQIAGVTCYVTYYDRSMTTEDSTESDLVCIQTVEVSFIPSNNMSVYSASKNLFFKDTKVARFYDKVAGTLVYLSYSTSTDGENAQHSLSVVKLR